MKNIRNHIVDSKSLCLYRTSNVIATNDAAASARDTDEVKRSYRRRERYYFYTLTHDLTYAVR